MTYKRITCTLLFLILVACSNENKLDQATYQKPEGIEYNKEQSAQASSSDTTNKGAERPAQSTWQTPLQNHNPSSLGSARPSDPHGVSSLAMAPQNRTATKQGRIPTSKARGRSAQSAYAVQGMNRESYNAVRDNIFVNVANKPFSSFSVDVDTASYANVRRFLSSGNLPPVGAVRTEEMINYFSYEYPEPKGGDPLALSAEVGPSPYHKDYQLVRIALAGQKFDHKQLPPSNIVFLIDVSGSMQAQNKLPLLQQALRLVVQQMGAHDRVSIVVYAGEERVLLKPTPGNQHSTILAALDSLRAEGSTHASSGIRAAYELARSAFIQDGNNRVILASDGDFNVGTTSRDELKLLIERERQAGVYLTVLGFGMNNYHDDAMEILADSGNGNYAYIDSLLEAKKVLIKEMGGTLFTLADDVKIQVEFNPAHVGAYRLLGYENRQLADEDFRDDSKDAGEIGLGHQVTVLYELIPAGNKDVPKLEPRKYQQNMGQFAGSFSNELLTVHVRYKPQGQAKSRLLSLPLQSPVSGVVSTDFRFAAAVAGFAMLLTDSSHLGDFTWEQCLELARSGRGKDTEGYRAEFYRLVEAGQLLKNDQSMSWAPYERRRN